MADINKIVNDRDELDVRDMAILTDAIEKTQYTVFKSYIDELCDMQVIAPDRDITEPKTEDYIRLLKLKKLTRQKGEDIMQKLTTIYNTVLSIGASLVVMIDDPGDSTVDIYLGVRNYVFKNKTFTVANARQALESGIKSQFPGSILEEVTTNLSMEGNIDDLMEAVMPEKISVNISAVSTVASVRDKSKTENKDFIQGIERFIDAMSNRKKSYTAIFIADPINAEQRMSIRSGMESLYSAMSPFSKNVWSYNENDSHAVMESLAHTVGTSVTDGTAKTQTHTISHTKGSSDALSVGLNVGMNKSETQSTTKAKIINLGANIGKLISAGGGLSIAKAVANMLGISAGLDIGYSHTWNRSDTVSYSDSDTTQHSETESESDTRTSGTTDTKGTGRTLQIENQNKMVIDILEKLDEQLKRLKECEDYGLSNCGAYFISRDKAVSILAANTYRSLITGDGSSVEKSAVNTWEKGDERADTIRDYLRHFYQPVFARLWDEDGNYMPFSAGTMVSGLELPLHMGLPISSVSGVTVVEHAAFGRNLSDKPDGISLGELYHMGNSEGGSVKLDANSLTAHTFITGSTGAGKSNTIYHMLSELKKQAKFLVIEPAKGEYKNVFGHDSDVSVYGTNPNFTELIRINPFSFPKNIHVYEHIDRLIEIFNACWPMYAAMPAVLKESIERAYVSAGWDMRSSVSKYGIFPCFADVIEKITEVIEESKYSSDSKGDYTGALTMRLRSLTNGINSLIFTQDELPDEDLFDKNVIVDISRVGSTETKALIMGVIIMKQQEYRMSMATRGNEALKHVTVLEEAHTLLKRTSTEQTSEGSNLLGKSVEMLANAIAEMRTYGEGFIIADQSPGLLDMSVIRNTNTKIILRLPDFSDRELVGKAAGLTDDQIIELAKLERGVAAVYQNDWIEAVLCKVSKSGLNESSYVHPQVEDPVQINAIRDLISYIMLSAPKKLEFDSDKVKDLERMIYKLHVTSQVKINMLRYIKETKPERINELRKKIIYSVFNSKTAFDLARPESRDLERWQRLMIENLVPDITSLSVVEREKILAIIALEQAQLEKDQKTNELLERIIASAKKI